MNTEGRIESVRLVEIVRGRGGNESVTNVGMVKPGKLVMDAGSMLERVSEEDL